MLVSYIIFILLCFINKIPIYFEVDVYQQRIHVPLPLQAEADIWHNFGEWDISTIYWVWFLGRFFIGDDPADVHTFCFSSFFFLSGMLSSSILAAFMLVEGKDYHSCRYEVKSLSSSMIVPIRLYTHTWIKIKCLSTIKT